MAQLWGGRFTKETDQLVYNFNASISFDQKFYKQDIEGSIAHVRMLGKQGILTQEEMQAIVSCLQEILADVESGKLAITSEYEDIHSFVEANLIDRLGDTGKKLHTGRSRNDQVALDMRLYTRQQVLETDELLEQLLQVLLRIMKENTQTIMPGFTHLQKAQPITLAHHMGAYFEMFKRDRSRMHDIYERMNYCPLGSGALAGTTYPLDREYTAELLGFYGPTLNSMDGVSDRHRRGTGVQQGDEPDRLQGDAPMQHRRLRGGDHLLSVAGHGRGRSWRAVGEPARRLAGIHQSAHTRHPRAAVPMASIARLHPIHAQQSRHQFVLLAAHLAVPVHFNGNRGLVPARRQRFGHE